MHAHRSHAAATLALLVLLIPSAASTSFYFSAASPAPSTSTWHGTGTGPFLGIDYEYSFPTNWMTYQGAGYAPGFAVLDLRVADIDGDGSTATLYAGNGGYGYTDEWQLGGYDFEWPSGWTDYFNAINLDADGDKDLIAASGDSGGWIKIHPGAGGHGWFSPTTRTGMGALKTIAVGDLDSDGDQDILWGLPNRDLYALRQSGNTLSFTKVLVYDAPDATSSTYTSTSTHVADLTGDGKPDVLTASDDGKVYLHRHTGSSGIAYTRSLLVDKGTPIKGAGVADLDDDGDLDILIGYSTYLDVFQQTSPGVFTSPSNFPQNTYFSFRGLDLGDIVGDDGVDVVLTSRLDDTRVLESRLSAGSTFATQWYSSGLFPTIQYDTNLVAVGDLDGDGRSDVYVAGDDTFETWAFIQDDLGTRMSATAVLPGELNSIAIPVAQKPNQFARLNLDQEDWPEGSSTVQVTVQDSQTGQSGSYSRTHKFDRSPPTSTLAITGQQSGSWYSSISSITLTATDSLSGLGTTSWSWSGATTDSGTTSTVSLPNSGSSTLSYYASDKAVPSNQEAVQSLVIRLDADAPTIAFSYGSTISSTGWNQCSDSSLALRFDVEDQGSGLARVEYRVDGGNWITTSGPRSTSPSGTGVTSVARTVPCSFFSDGLHTFTVRATDGTGLVTQRSSTLRFDRTPPSASFALAGTVGENGWHTRLTSAIVDASDAHSGIGTISWQWDLDSSLGGTGATVAIPNQGHSRLTYWATDRATPIHTTSPPDVDVYFDRLDPVVKVLPANGHSLTAWNSGTSSATAFNIQAEDVKSGLVHVEWSLDDGQSWAPLFGPLAPSRYGSLSVFQYEVAESTFPEGITAMRVRAMDSAGNTEEFVQDIKWDNSPPTSTLSYSGSGGSNGWYQELGNLEIDATDTLAGVASTPWQWSGDTTTSGSTSTPSVPLDGISVLSYQARDAAQPSNQEQGHEWLVRVDREAPITTILLHDAATASWSSATGTTPAVSYFTQDATSGLWEVEREFIGATDAEMVLPPVALDGNGHGQLTAFGEDFVAQDFPEGWTRLWTRSRDAAGHEGFTSTDLYYDRTAPQLTPQDPVHAGNLQSGALLELGVMVTDPPGPDGSMSDVLLESERMEYREDQDGAPAQSLAPSSQGGLRTGFVETTTNRNDPTRVDPMDDYLYYRYDATDRAQPPNEATTGWVEVPLPTHHDSGAYEDAWTSYPEYEPDSSDASRWSLRESRVDTTTNNDPCGDASDPPETKDGLTAGCTADESVAIRLDMYPGDLFNPGQDLHLDVSVNGAGTGISGARAYPATITVTCWVLNHQDAVRAGPSSCSPDLQASILPMAGSGAGTRSWGASVSQVASLPEKLAGGHFVTHVRVEACVADPGLTGGEACASNVLAVVPYQVHTTVTGNTAPGAMVQVRGHYTRITSTAGHEVYCNVEIAVQAFSRSCPKGVPAFSLADNSVTWSLTLPEVLLGSGRSHFGTAYTDTIDTGLVVAAGDGHSNAKASRIVNELSLLAELWGRDDQPDLASTGFVFPPLLPRAAGVESLNVVRVSNTGGTTLHVHIDPVLSGPGGGVDGHNRITVPDSLSACLRASLAGTPTCVAFDANGQATFALGGDGVRFLSLRVEGLSGGANGVQRAGAYTGPGAVEVSLT